MLNSIWSMQRSRCALIRQVIQLQLAGSKLCHLPSIFRDPMPYFPTPRLQPGSQMATLLELAPPYMGKPRKLVLENLGSVHVASGVARQLPKTLSPDRAWNGRARSERPLLSLTSLIAR
jgi:hypothetical protein